jgi:ADP-heptose:LPS heptosyltransferase
VVANLDLVIGVDTAVTNLSAAMDVPTWVVSTVAEFRWGIEGLFKSWYPSAKFFKG